MQQNADARFIGAEREQNASVTPMWWFQKARAWTAQRGAGWPCGLFARAPRSVAVRSLQLPALELSRFLGSSPCVRVASYLSAECSLPRAMLVNIDVVIKTWR